MPENARNELDAKLAKKTALLQRKAFIAGSVIAAGGLVLVLLLGQLDGFFSPAESATTTLATEPEVPQNSATREELQQPLNQQQANIRELLSKPAKSNWAKPRVLAMQASLEQLFLQYAAGQYDAVQAGLETLAIDLENYNLDYHNAYSDLHNKAQTAFVAQDIDSARFHNSKSLEVNPGYGPAISLQQQILAYPEVAALKNALAVAEVERNLDKQVALLQQILQLDAAHPKEQAKLDSLLQQVKDRDYSEAIAKSLNALGQDDLESAHHYLQLANSIDSGRNESGLVQQQIAARAKQLRLLSLQQTLQQLQQQDDWPGAKQHAQVALQEYPNHSGFREAVGLAESIMASTGYLSDYVARPERLFDSNIKRVAGEDLVIAQQLAAHSPALSGLVAQVNSLLESAKAPVPVDFISDGKTDIRVLGIGVVGKTELRAVELTPGTYQVEGKCAGYKSTLQTLVVLPGQDNQITVTCEEKI